MCTISDTVEITTSIITEIGSSRMPRSICSVRLIGSHTVFHGTSVGNTPEASRPAEKYSNAVQ